jgi:hypothetical protein
MAKAPKPLRLWLNLGSPITEASIPPYFDVKVFCASTTPFTGWDEYTLVTKQPKPRCGKRGKR